MSPTSRRQFIASTLALSATLSAKPALAAAAYPVSCNLYSWLTFFRRDGREWSTDLEYSMAQFAQSGIKAVEPGFERVADAEALLPLLQRHGIAMPSFYVNSVLHDPALAPESLATVLAIARVARKAGARIVVTNPNPIRWGGPEIKNDAQLSEQARNLDRLGAELRSLGLTLAYHTHDIEFRAGGRELHHMLLNTLPENMSFCMDVHWIYRGSDNSSLAVFDILKLYGSRLAVLHLRQSKAGIWQEVFTDQGDIDYARLASELARWPRTPLLVLEQCLEAGSPANLSAVEAHRQDLAQVQKTFAGLFKKA